MTRPDEPAETAPEALEREFTLDHAPARVWAALTEGRLLAEWLLPGDIPESLAPGNVFSVRGGREGRVDCEVVELVPGRRLSCTWRTHGDRDPRPPGAVDALVTFDLVPLPGDRTLLRIRQAEISASARTPSAPLALAA